MNTYIKNNAQQELISNNSNNNYLEYNNKRPNIQDEINKNYLKPEYLIDSKTFDEIHKKSNLNNNYIYPNNNNKKQESKKNLTEREKQNIKILKNLLSFDNKKENKTKRINKKENRNININNINNYNTYKNPIELTLYNDAIKRRQKLQNIDKNVIKGIKLNSNKTKITNTSYKVAIERDEKLIEQVINKYSVLNKKTNIKSLNIIGIALALRDLRIFRELFKINKNNANNNIYNISDLHKIILSVEKKETRKIKELNFLEQTWLLLNPEQNEYINKDIFIGLLKIIFSPEGTLKEIESLLKKYLEAAIIGANIPGNLLLDNANLNNKNSNKYPLISPIINKKLTIADLWPLSKYIKIFFELKKNLIAYKTTNNLSSDKYSNLKHQKIQSNLVHTDYTLENNKSPEKNKKNFNFDKLYKKFVEKEQCKKITLEQMRKKKDIEELKELKQKPTITKYKFNSEKNNEYYPKGKKRENIHDRLYKLDKDIREKKLELIEEKERKEKEKIDEEINSYRLTINRRRNKQTMNKSFDQPKKMKGFDEFVKRNRNGRLERLRVKYLLEKTPTGERYEEIRRRNITPPNITDIRNMRKKEYYKNKNTNNIIKNTRDRNEYIVPDEYDLSDNVSDGNTDYFNLQIKLPNGKVQTLKVYENDDANKVVEEFCKIHSIDNNIKNKLIANVENCQKEFLNKDNKNYYKNDNISEEVEEEEGEEEEEEEENNVVVDENNHFKK